MSTYKFDIGSGSNKHWYNIECADPFNLTNEENLEFLLTHTAPKVHNIINSKSKNGTIVYKGVRPDPDKNNGVKNISTNEKVFYFSNSPVVAGGYTLWDNFAFCIGILPNTKKQIKSTLNKKSYKGAKQVDNISEYLKEAQWISVENIDLIKNTCDQILTHDKITGKEIVVNRLGGRNQAQSQIIVEENCIWFDIIKNSAYQVKKMWNYYKVV